MKKYIKLMRVKHYVKNFLIMLPLIFSGQLLNLSLLKKTVFGIISFCFISSVVYIINDIRDKKSDSLHPTKCNRPIANGSVSVRLAWILASVLLVLAAITGCFSCGFNLWAWGFMTLYLSLNLLYSLGLKNVPIIDIAILVSGFLLRVLYGSIITEIEISKWLYLTVISMSFYLGLGKRRNEIVGQADGKTRKVLGLYNYNFLDKNMYMSLALTIVFYSLWSVDPITIARLGNGNLVWSVPLVILICMKYSLMVEGNSDGDPVEVIFKDKMLLGLIGLFCAITVGIIYI